MLPVDYRVHILIYLYSIINTAQHSSHESGPKPPIKNEQDLIGECGVYDVSSCNVPLNCAGSTLVRWLLLSVKDGAQPFPHLKNRTVILLFLSYSFFEFFY